MQVWEQSWSDNCAANKERITNPLVGSDGSHFSHHHLCQHHPVDDCHRVGFTADQLRQRRARRSIVAPDGFVLFVTVGRAV